VKKHQMFAFLVVVSLSFLSSRCGAAQVDTNGFARFETEVRSTSWTNEWYTDVSVPMGLYSHDAQKADSLYLKKVWPLKGIVVAVRKVDTMVCLVIASTSASEDSESELALAPSIYCYFSGAQSKELTALLPYDMVYFKGLGIGRDIHIPLFVGCVLLKSKRHGTP